MNRVTIDTNKGIIRRWRVDIFTYLHVYTPCCQCCHSIVYCQCIYAVCNVQALPSANTCKYHLDLPVVGSVVSSSHYSTQYHRFSKYNSLHCMSRWMVVVGRWRNSLCKSPPGC